MKVVCRERSRWSLKNKWNVKKWVLVPLKYVGRLMAMIQLIPNVRQVLVRELNNYTACHIVISSMCMGKLCKSRSKWWLLLQLWTCAYLQLDLTENLWQYQLVYKVPFVWQDQVLNSRLQPKSSRVLKIMLGKENKECHKFIYRWHPSRWDYGDSRRGKTLPQMVQVAGKTIRISQGKSNTRAQIVEKQEDWGVSFPEHNKILLVEGDLNCSQYVGSFSRWLVWGCIKKQGKAIR